MRKEKFQRKNAQEEIQNSGGFFSAPFLLLSDVRLCIWWLIPTILWMNTIVWAIFGITITDILARTPHTLTNHHRNYSKCVPKNRVFVWFGALATNNGKPQCFGDAVEYSGKMWNWEMSCNQYEYELRWHRSLICAYVFICSLKQETPDRRW